MIEPLWGVIKKLGGIQITKIKKRKKQVRATLKIKGDIWNFEETVFTILNLEFVFLNPYTPV